MTHQSASAGANFDANDGNYASINSYGETTQNGANLLTMTTNADYYGWYTAIVEHGVSAVPEPVSMTALRVGILALARHLRS